MPRPPLAGFRKVILKDIHTDHLITVSTIGEEVSSLNTFSNSSAETFHALDSLEFNEIPAIGGFLHFIVAISQFFQCNYFFSNQIQIRRQVRQPFISTTIIQTLVPPFITCRRCSRRRRRFDAATPKRSAPSRFPNKQNVCNFFDSFDFLNFRSKSIYCSFLSKQRSTHSRYSNGGDRSGGGPISGSYHSDVVARRLFRAENWRANVRLNVLCERVKL